MRVMAMQEILSKYKERLINISSRNRSLVTKKLYKKNSFDLFKLKKFNSNIDLEIIDMLINRKEGAVTLLQDPYKYHKDTEAEEMLDYSQSLSYLVREISSIEKETGRYELYVGYPFVEGYFKDKTFVKAPLLLFPVRIYNKNDNWYIENILDQNIILNKVFILAFSRYNGVKLNDVETEFVELKEKGIHTFQGLIKFLEAVNITIKLSTDAPVEKFIEHTRDSAIDYNLGELELKPYFVLGQFTMANSIYNDYAILADKALDNKLLKRLLINEENAQTSLDTDKDEGEKLAIKDTDYYFISPLDFSQEKAIRNVNAKEQLVIYGPPGTGKSQTIANIIADGLSKGKKILMVSQKRAAMDVIYNRIADFSSKVVLIHDVNKDKKAFYEKVNIQLDNNKSACNESLEKNITYMSEKIDNMLSYMDNLAEVLHKPRKFGLTLQQMYSKSKKITSIEDSRYKDFKNFRNHNCFNDMDYPKLTKVIDDLLVKGAIGNYCNYKNYLANNEIILKINETLDSFDIDEGIEAIDSLYIKYKDTVKLSVEENQLTEMLLQLYKEQAGDVSEDNIVKLGNDINNQDNKELLVKLNNVRWWNVSSWINYSKNKKQEEANRAEFEKRGIEIRNCLISCSEQIKSFLKDVGFLRNILIQTEYENFLKIIFDKKELNEYIGKIKAALQIYENYRDLIAGLSYLSEEELRILVYAYGNSEDSLQITRLIKQLPEFAILDNISKIEAAERDQLVKYKEFAALKEQINNSMQQKQRLVPAHIINLWDNIITQTVAEHPAMEKEFRRQASKKRQLFPLRKYISEFSVLLFDLFPCWLLSPETVSEIMPLTEGLFDLIIFDEASQMFIENAIPAIYRSKRIVVAGDDKQLRPLSSFKIRMEEEENIEELETAAALEEESLLDLAKVNYDAIHLNYHYRSQYDELINFSNYAFYGGRLEVSPNITKDDDSSERAIERIKLEGRWIDRKNVSEAEKVVEIIDNILKCRIGNETLGVITFNVTQKDLIDDLLESKAMRDPVFKSLYYNEMNRVNNNEDLGLFVKNIENVQGDERDIIIFSTGYAPNESNKLSVNFGSLSQEGGENRLNVAISRAKEKIYVVTSIEPEELNVDNTKNNGPKLLKKYLQYAREISNGNKEDAKSILKSLLDSGIGRNDAAYFDSGFEEEVYQKLIELGYEVDTQIGVSGYKIDLGIYDRNSSQYILGIECDGAAYHSSKFARERDIHRQRYLESRGWRIMRIWSKDWWENPDKEIKKIMAAI